MNHDKKTAPNEGPNGVDRWTSNGYGLILNGVPVPPIEETPEAEEAHHNTDDTERT